MEYLQVETTQNNHAITEHSGEKKNKTFKWTLTRNRHKIYKLEVINSYRP